MMRTRADYFARAHPRRRERVAGVLHIHRSGRRSALEESPQRPNGVGDVQVVAAPCVGLFRCVFFRRGYRQPKFEYFLYFYSWCG